MRVHVVRKWPLPGEKSFCVLEYHTVSLWLLCNVHFVHSIVPPLSRDLADLKARIIAAVKNIDAPMLTCVCVCVWQELEHRTDVCRVTRGAHIEHLLLSKKKPFQFSCGCEQFH